MCVRSLFSLFRYILAGCCTSLEKETETVNLKRRPVPAICSPFSKTARPVSATRWFSGSPVRSSTVTAKNSESAAVAAKTLMAASEKTLHEASLNLNLTHGGGGGE